MSSARYSDHGGSAVFDNSSNASSAQPMGSGGSNALLTTQAVTSPTFHVGAMGRVALQTAEAVVKGNNKSARVRVLFDARSHRSFITTRAVKMTGVPIEGKEWIEISTFSQRTKDCGLRAVYELDVFPLQGRDGIKIEAYEVPTIAEIGNQHIEIRKGEYSYLQSLWFLDVNLKDEVLGIDLLIGTDYLRSFQKGRTIRGEAGEPVAIETCLGWVLSGPMKGFRDDSQISVNLVSQVIPRDNLELDNSIWKLWDLKTLGIREENKIHEELKDAISFNGQRYEVSLPWKEGHGPLPNNYRNSLKRLKGQIEKLQNDPDVLKAYDAVIKEQAAVGIVERVPELETPEKIQLFGTTPKPQS